MNRMQNKIIIPSILFISVLIFSFFALSKEKSKKQLPENETKTENNQQESSIILFYGDGCPHCKIIEEYIAANGIQNKILFDKKEIYHNKNNASDLEAKAKICGIPANSIGVPFLWSGEKCFMGDQDIIEFFSAKSGASSEEKQKNNE